MMKPKKKVEKIQVLEMTKLSKKQQREKMETLLDEFNLQRVRKNNGDTLSGGERRRTEIARALAVDPKFILLDEPFAGVDPIAVEDIQAIVAKLKFRNIGILITDHNVNETLSICDRAYLLIDGKIFTHGTAEELAGDEQVRRLYLGKNFELKRKDYLHDEAKEEGREDTSAGNYNTSFESVLQHCIIDTGKKIGLLNKIGLYKLNFTYAEDIRLDDYSKYIDEIKNSLFVKSHYNDTEINNLISRLPSFIYTKYKGRLKFYDNYLFLLFIGGLLGLGLPWLIIYLIYGSMFKEIRNTLSEIHAILSEVNMLIHAKNN